MEVNPHGVHNFIRKLPGVRRSRDQGALVPPAELPYVSLLSVNVYPYCMMVSMEYCLMTEKTSTPPGHPPCCHYYVKSSEVRRKSIFKRVEPLLLTGILASDVLTFIRIVYIMSLKTAFALGFLSLVCLVTADHVVDLGYAKYRGNLTFPNTVSYLGLPYAEPPLGDRRFRAPLPLNTARVSAQANGRVIDATSYPNFCIQGTTGRKSSIGYHFSRPSSRLLALRGRSWRCWFGRLS